MAFDITTSLTGGEEHHRRFPLSVRVPVSASPRCPDPPLNTFTFCCEPNQTQNPVEAPSLPSAPARAPALTADEAGRLQYLLLLLLLAPQISKSVNNDPKDEVKDDDNDNKEEEQVIDNPSGKQGLL